MPEDSNIKRLLKQREEQYLQATQEIISHFFIPLKEALSEVIYEDSDVQMVIQSLLPIPRNLNYVNIVLRAASYKVGDIFPIQGESNSPITLEVTEENFWEVADTITLNVPISILEIADKDIIIEYMKDLGNDIDASDHAENGYETTEIDKDDKLDMSELNLDEVQKSLLKIHTENKKKH